MSDTAVVYRTRLGVLALLSAVLAAPACTAEPAWADAGNRASAVPEQPSQTSAAQDPPGKEAAQQKSAPPPAPQTPKSARTACQRDADCVLMPPRPCSCPPCGDVWKETLNQKEYEKLRANWARRRCVAPVCEQCEGRYLGTEAVCVSGYCTVR